MKKPMFIVILMLNTFFVCGQNYSMNGTFVCRNPPFSGIDSTKLTFTSTNYEYFINNQSTPSSSGTYQVQYIGGGKDTLILTETTGACIGNGGKNPIKFKILKNAGPKNYVTLEETSQSNVNCPTHSNKIIGEYEAVNGVFVGIKSVDTSNSMSHVFMDVFPNPCKNIFEVKCNFKIQEIKVYNLLGIEQNCQICYESKVVVDLPADIYFIYISDVNGNIYTQRISIE